jgi:biopolymer transport protein ExbB/TolQ
MEPTVSLLQILESGLFALGQVLRFPVMVLLWLCVAAAVFMVGHAIVESVARQRERRNFDITGWLQSGRVLDAGEARLGQLPTLLRRLSEDVEHGRRVGTLDHGGLEHLLLEREEQVRHTLLIPRVLVKVGPSIGLIGTLIPMGASLASLASGNLEVMAGQMVVAFTSTIVGLTTGTLAYMVASTRQVWATEAVREHRFLVERIATELAEEPATSDGVRSVD